MFSPYVLMNSGGSSSATMQQVDFKVGTEDECLDYFGCRYSHPYQLCGVIPHQSTFKVR